MGDGVMSEEAFREGLDADGVRRLQILQVGLGAGVAAFALLIAVLHAQGVGAAKPIESQVETLRMMSLAHGAVAVTTWSTAIFLWRSSVRPKLAAATDAVSFLQEWQVGTILWLALFEAPAMFGLVICFQLVQSGNAEAHSELLGNGVTAAVQLLLTAATFPTADRLVNAYREEVLVRGPG
jgi:hypothetical protein